MKDSLKLLRSADFDWAMHLQGVWDEPAYDVPSFQSSLRYELSSRLDQLRESTNAASPLGWVVFGSGGSGKTHLLSILRRKSFARNIAFVLVDMTDVHDFWATVLLGYFNSLQQPQADGKPQRIVLLEKLLGLVVPEESLPQRMDDLRSAQPERLASWSAELIGSLGRHHAKETLLHQDVIRALIALNSDDFATVSIGMTWLNGHPIEAIDRQMFGFTPNKKSAREIVRGLSWLMSLVGPTVLAFDQLDPIVSQLNLLNGAPEGEAVCEEIAVARSIIENIACGLGSLRDLTCRTLTVISCLETTWDSFVRRMGLDAHADRFEPGRKLGAINQPAVAEAIVRARMEAAQRLTGVCPPYPTWPFAVEAFQDVQGVSPRQILKLCYAHRRRCLKRGEVAELRRLSVDANPGPESDDTCEALGHLDQRLADYCRRVAPGVLLEEKADDECLGPLLETAARAAVLEASLPVNVDAVVDVDFHNDKKIQSLHARLRLIHNDEGDREDHFCLRALQRDHHLAFQARLKAAMTQSGIDHRLSFRRLAIVRLRPLPKGPATQKLVEEFQRAGGVFVRPSEDDLRTLWAVQRLFAEKDPYLHDWLASRRPVTRLPLLRELIPSLAAPATPVNPQPLAAQQNDRQAVPVKDPVRHEDPKPQPTLAPPSPASVAPILPQPGDRNELPPDKVAGKTACDDQIPMNLPLGRKRIGEDPLSMRLSNLSQHTVILAGAGSGKTVLLRRLIEEAALLGTPAIVIDCANDLSSLGQAWPQIPESWTAEDQAKAREYQAKTEVVVWTPGKDAGNPLVLRPLPDFAAIADDPEELQEAILMACEYLRPLVAPGNSLASKKKNGILRKAMRHFAKQGGSSLADFAELLSDLPPEAGLQVQKESKLALDIADTLRVQMEIDPLLRPRGQALDPAVLLGDVPGCTKVRISVINLMGLPSLEFQQQFLNQLAMTLFGWIKKHPCPPGRPLRGLLAIDEARDFVPSIKASVCKESLKRLTAQARKYALGLLFATQHPKDIDNKLVANCSTHFYGKANAPAAIDAIKEQIQLRGGSGGDIAKLPKGQFYVYNADAGLKAPEKVQVPLCLSYHRPNPLDGQQIMKLAKECREQLPSLMPAPEPAWGLCPNDTDVPHISELV